MAASACSTDRLEAPEPTTTARLPLCADAAAAPSPAAELSKTEWLFDDHAAPRRFDVEVDPADWAWLQDHATDEEYVPCNIELEGEHFESAAIRYKGGYGSLYACFSPEGEQLCDKLSLKVSFTKYVDKGRFMGVRKLVFNSSNRDDTYLHERLSYGLFRAAGVEASRAVHARLSINGGPESLYVLVESIDEEWIEDRFEDDSGNLYKEVWPQHFEPEPYLAALRTNEDSADVSRMITLATLLAGVGDASFNSMIDPWIDRDVMASYLVVDQMTLNWDGIWKFYCQGDWCSNHNYYLYEDPISGRIVVIPWDLDHTFNTPNTDLARSWWIDEEGTCDVQQQSAWIGTRAPQCDPLLGGLMLQGWELYRERFAELTEAEGPLTEAAILERLDRYRAQIAPYIAGDPLGPDALTWRRAVAKLRQIIRRNTQEAATFLAEDPGDVP